MIYWQWPKTRSTAASLLIQVAITAAAPTPAVEAIVPEIPLFHNILARPFPQVTLYSHKSHKVCMVSWDVLVWGSVLTALRVSMGAPLGLNGCRKPHRFPSLPFLRAVSHQVPVTKVPFRTSTVAPLGRRYIVLQWSLASVQPDNQWGVQLAFMLPLEQWPSTIHQGDLPIHHESHAIRLMCEA